MAKIYKKKLKLAISKSRVSFKSERDFFTFKLKIKYNNQEQTIPDVLPKRPKFLDFS